MPDPIRVEVEGLGVVEFPPGTSPETIERAMREAQFKAERGQPSLFDRAVGALPAVGGLAGGIVGGIGGTAFGVGVGGVPGAVGGATLGGAAGEAARQLVQRARGQEAPGTPGGAAVQIGKEGAIQGALELAGAGVAGTARAAGRGLMEHAIRPTITQAKEFGDIAATAIKERIPVGSLVPGMKKGSELAREKLLEASRALRARLEQYSRMGISFDAVNTFAKPVNDLLVKMADDPIGDAAQSKVADLITEFLKRHPGPLTPTQLKDLKQAAQAIATPIYRALNRGAVPTETQQVAAQFNKAVASGAKQALETLPGVAQAESRKQGLIGVERAVKQSELRRLSLMAEGVSGSAGILAGVLAGQRGTEADQSLVAAATTWLVTRGLASPRSISRGALVLTQKQMQALFKQFPRLAEIVIEQSQLEGSK